jgi:hypothetical protein
MQSLNSKDLEGYITILLASVCTQTLSIGSRGSEVKELKPLSSVRQMQFVSSFR